MSIWALSDCSLLSCKDWVSLRAWYQIRGRHCLPWRQETTPWKVLLAETMLHRTRADAVEAIYPLLAQEFPSPEAVVTRKERWLEATRGAGLMWRAEQFITACRILVEEYRGQVPPDREALLALPGVGHYIAAAVRCFGFGFPEVIVDTNTVRLAGRISGVSLNPANHRSRETQQMVARLGKGSRPSNAPDNYALLDLAASICRPLQPRCSECPIRSDCATGRASLP